MKTDTICRFCSSCCPNPDYSLNRLTDDERRSPIIGTPSGRRFMCQIAKAE